MSGKSWLAEFYPVKAHLVAEGDALAHSIRKWYGLSPSNLEAHDCIADDDVYDTKGQLVLDVSGDSCALCAHHNTGEEAGCRRCPIVRVTGTRCDDSDSDDESAWHSWSQHRNPVPMQELLAHVERNLGLAS